MAKIKPRNAFSKQMSNGFGGIGSTSPLSGVGAADMSNFRIRSDGTLVPREGTRTLWSFNTTEKIRGFWEGTVQNQSFMFAVVGKQVYRLNPESQSRTLCATLKQSDGRVRFVIFKDTLYLLDGVEMLHWSISSQRFEAFNPYVPLYGYMWEPKGMGDVNEPINLLTPHVRVHYLNSSATTTFYLPFYPKQIDSIRSPDKRLSTYTFVEGSNVITIPEAASCSTVIISMTIDIDTAARSRILQAHNAHAYIQKGGETLLLYGTDGDWRTYCSAPVSDQMLYECSIDYSDTLPVYFRSDDILFLGDSDHPVTAICPHYDALLAFNSAQTWLLQPGEASAIDAYALINDTGAVSPDAVTLCTEAPAVVTDGGVYLIQSSSSRPEILTYKCISSSLWDKLPRDVLTDPLLYRNIREDELWLTSPDDDSVWVYSVPKKEWYRFTGIAASFFADSSMGTVFASGDRLVLFDSTLFADSDQPYQCTYVSNYCDFGAPESTRRTVRASVSAALDGGTASLSVMTDRGTKHFTLTGGTQDLPEHFDFRIHMGRHRFLQFAISLPASPHATVYKTAFYTNR